MADLRSAQVHTFANDLAKARAARAKLGVHDAVKEPSIEKATPKTAPIPPVASVAEPATRFGLVNTLGKTVGGLFKGKKSKKRNDTPLYQVPVPPKSTPNTTNKIPPRVSSPSIVATQVPPAVVATAPKETVRPMIAAGQELVRNDAALPSWETAHTVDLGATSVTPVTPTEKPVIDERTARVFDFAISENPAAITTSATAAVANPSPVSLRDSAVLPSPHTPTIVPEKPRITPIIPIEPASRSKIPVITPSIPPQQSTLVASTPTTTKRITPTIPVYRHEEVVPAVTPIPPTPPIQVVPEPLPERVVAPKPLPVPAPIVAPSAVVTQETLNARSTLMSDESLQVPRGWQTGSGPAERRAQLASLQTQPSAIPPKRLPRLALPLLAGGLFVLVAASSVAYIVFGTRGEALPDLPTSSTDFPATSGGVTNFPSEQMGNNFSLQLPDLTKRGLYTTLQNVDTSGETFITLAPLHPTTGFTLTRDEILELITNRVPTTIFGTVGDIRLGYYRDKPTIILSVENGTEARGLLYAWEATMSVDLFPWFSPIVRNESRLSVSLFGDAVSGSTDVRVLKTPEGTEVITYGFVNPTTVVITTDTASFLNIASTYTGL